MRNRLYDVVIAIDPDIDKSGICRIDTNKGGLEVSKLAFPLLVEYVQDEYEKAKGNGQRFHVFVEAGWLNESNWHVNNNMSGHYGAAIGECVGRNQGVGMLALQMFAHKEIPAEGLKPLPKTIRIGSKRLSLWRGKDGKITRDELDKVIARNGLQPIDKRINQDERDAVLIALDGAGYPILK